MNPEVEVEPLFQLTAECPACGKSFVTSRIRPRFKKTVHVDTDFCPHYADPVLNPDYYVVQVCEHCGCATTEHAMKRWTEQQLAAFNSRVASQWQPRPYGGERDWSSALATYQLALVTAQAIQESKRVIAGLLHHVAWLYRYAEDTAQEKKYLRHALQAYQDVYERESGEVNDARLIYITGELHRRLGEYQEAGKCFTRLIQDKRITDAAMIRAAREQWAAMREEMAGMKLELIGPEPDEGRVRLKYSDA